MRYGAVLQTVQDGTNAIPNIHIKETIPDAKAEIQQKATKYSVTTSDSFTTSLQTTMESSQ